jgi:hypothetical protein
MRSDKVKQKPKPQARSNNVRNAKPAKASQNSPGKIQAGKTGISNTSSSGKVRSQIKSATQAGVFTLARASYSPNAASNSNLTHSDSSWNAISQPGNDANDIHREGFSPIKHERQFIEKNRVTADRSPQFNEPPPPAMNSMYDTLSHPETFAPKKKQKQLPVESPWEKMNPAEVSDSIADRIKLMEEKNKIPPHLLSQKYFGSQPR